MNLQNIAKTAGILGLAGKMVKPLGSLLGFHTLNAGIGAVTGAMGSPGSMKAKLGQGARQFTKSFFNPREFAHNVVGYNIVPTIGAKAIGTVGKGLQKIKPGSMVGKFMSGMDKTKGNTFFQNYIMGQGAGFIPSMAIGSTLGEKVSGGLTQLPQMGKIKDLMQSGGRAPRPF